MDMRYAGNTIEMLREALFRLADTAEHQIAWLIEKRVDADELALEFNDQALVVPQLVEAGYLSQDAGIAVEALDRHLDRISGQENAALWDDEALQHSDEWVKVRALASAAFRTLPQKPTTPDLSE